MTHPNFLHSVEANLAFWRACMGNHETEAIIYLDNNFPNLYQAIQVGLLFPETQSDTATLALDLYEFIESRNHIREWIPILQKTFNTPIAPSEKCRLLNHLGYTHTFVYKYPEAMEHHQQALALSQETGNAREEMNAYFGLALVLYYFHEYEQANHHAKIAQERFHQLPPHTNPRFDQAKLSSIYTLLGIIANSQGNYTEAEPLLLRALEVRKDHPNLEFYAQCLLNLAETYGAQQKNEKAVHTYQEILAIYEKTGNTHALVTTLLSLGTLYFRFKQFALADETFQRIDQSYLRHAGDFIRLATLFNNFGNVYLQQGRLTMAKQFLTEAIAYWRQLPDDLSLANTLSDLAETCLKLNTPEQALPLYLEALPILSRYSQDAWARRLLENALAQARKAFPDHPAFR